MLYSIRVVDTAVQYVVQYVQYIQYTGTYLYLSVQVTEDSKAYSQVFTVQYTGTHFTRTYCTANTVRAQVFNFRTTVILTCTVLYLYYTDILYCTSTGSLPVGREELYCTVRVRVRRTHKCTA